MNTNDSRVHPRTTRRGHPITDDAPTTLTLRQRLGQRVRHLRRHHALTQRELGIRLGDTPHAAASSIVRIAAGTMNIRWHRLFQLADALHMSASDLVEGL